MDLDSWKPSDVYRRVSIAVSAQLAIFLGCALVLPGFTAWYVGWPAAILFGSAIHFVAMRVHRARRRR